MDSNNLFIKAAALVVSIIVLTAGGCTSYKSYLLANAAVHGADPLRLACASGTGQEAVCVILVNK